MTTWQRIYTVLKQNEIDVYSPAQHKGECISPYVVVKDAGLNQFGQFSSTRVLYDVMCYVPRERFSELESYVSKVKQILQDFMYPELVPMNFETASFYDDTVKGHMISVQYRNARKLKS